MYAAGGTDKPFACRGGGVGVVTSVTVNRVQQTKPRSGSVNCVRRGKLCGRQAVTVQVRECQAMRRGVTNHKQMWVVPTEGRYGQNQVNGVWCDQ